MAAVVHRFPPEVKGKVVLVLNGNISPFEHFPSSFSVAGGTRERPETPEKREQGTLCGLDAAYLLANSVLFHDRTQKL